MALSADKILTHAGTYDTKEVHVPKWADENGDDVVIVRGMTIAEFEIHQGRLERERLKGGDKDIAGDATAMLIARCAIDEHGGRLFTDAQVPLISQLGMGEVMRLSSAIDELSGFGDEAKDAVAGESAAAPTSDSPSA